MSTGNAWSTELYAATNGRVPVAEFLDGLDAKTRTRFRWSMEQLRVRNVAAREPLVKKLDDGLRQKSDAGWRDGPHSGSVAALAVT